MAHNFQFRITIYDAMEIKILRLVRRLIQLSGRTWFVCALAIVTWNFIEMIFHTGIAIFSAGKLILRNNCVPGEISRAGKLACSESNKNYLICWRPLKWCSWRAGNKVVSTYIYATQESPPPSGWLNGLQNQRQTASEWNNPDSLCCYWILLLWWICVLCISVSGRRHCG
jgi:hypothetical protein